MRNRFRGSTIVLATVAAGAVFSLAVGTAGQTPAYKAPRTADGKPNLSGFWQALSTAQWDLQDHPARPSPLFQLGAILAEPAGQGVVEGNEIPYQPWAAAKKKENFEKRWSFEGLTLDSDPNDRFTIGDPEMKCFMPGIPRATYQPFPFEIVQTPKYILMAYEFATANRLINMEKPKESPIDYWMGWSNGHWEGETLVADVRNFNGKTWFDRAGNFASDKLHVVERYTAISPDHLTYEVTIEDPTVFTRPWKISLPLYRRVEKNFQPLEFKCIEFAEELVYGRLRKQPSK